MEKVVGKRGAAALWAWAFLVFAVLTASAPTALAFVRTLQFQDNCALVTGSYYVGNYVSSRGFRHSPTTWSYYEAYEVRYGICSPGHCCNCLVTLCEKFWLQELPKDPIYLTWHQSNCDGFKVASKVVGIVGKIVPGLARRWGKVAGFLTSSIADNHCKLANDPPDPNYLDLYQYPQRTLAHDWGLSPTANQHLNQALLALARVDDALLGELVSIERAQGAIVAIPAAPLEANEAAQNQGAAAQRFRQDHQVYANQAAQLIRALPGVLQAEGVSDRPFNAAELEADIDDLEQNGVPQDLASLLVGLTGDPAAAGSFLAFALSLRGSTTSETAFSSLQALSAELEVSNCSNALDDDGDGLVDFPADPECTSATDVSEGDRDNDGVDDAFDNCPDAFNPDQADVGGLGASSTPDGVGDACQCGDVTGDGRITLSDAVTIQRSLLNPPTATMAHPERCDVGGSLECSLADAVTVRRALLSPATAAIVQTCAPANP